MKDTDRPPQDAAPHSDQVENRTGENRMFAYLPFPEGLALRFLGTFARFEYALKLRGFAKGNSNSVEADWNVYARAIDSHFCELTDRGFCSAVNYLLAEPPRKQVLKNGHLTWKDSPPNAKLPRAEQTLLMVRRVRNNLFHGAKVWSIERGSRDRDIRLLKTGMIILQHCSRLDHHVQLEYERSAF